MKKKNTQDDQLNQAIRITELETCNQALQEKLKLLRIQLESQTQFQYAARNLRSRSASLNRSRNNLSSSRNFRSTNALKSRVDHAQPETAKSYDSIYRELNVLQEEFENLKKQHLSQISELENQLTKKENSSPMKLKNELDENIELINLKRFSKKQTAQISSLQSDLIIANAEIKQLQTDVSSITALKDNLQSELSKEKSAIVKLNSDLSTLKENIKLLEQQLKDLQTEKATLKEHNENLLNLSFRRESTGEASDSKTLYLKQIKKLEEDLKSEIIAKTDLSSKVVEAELQNIKLSSTITELQSKNSSLKDELEEIKEKIRPGVVLKSESNIIKTYDKSVMTSNVDHYDLKSDGSMNPDLKLRLHETEVQLNQCKELLRVQCSLNVKHKQEIENLQKMFHENETLTSDHLRNFQLLLRNHHEELARIANQRHISSLYSMLVDLRNFISTKKFGSFQDNINIISKLLEGYISSFESAEDNSLSHEKNDVLVDTPIEKLEKSVQVEIVADSLTKPDTNINSEISEVDAILPVANEQSHTVIFELRIERANFTSFSDHLMKSTHNDPKIFLTWNFLNDNEHQAYTPTISVSEGVFNCTCQYEGPWSQFLDQYLKKTGIRIEIHLVQEDISVRLADTVISTSSALENPNKCENFRSTFKNDNIEGDVVGSFILKCDPALRTLFA